jgi:hypothetical protein
LTFDPKGHEVLFASEHATEAELAGTTFTLEDFQLSNFKDVKLLDDAGKPHADKSSQLFKINHDVVEISRMDLVDMEMTKGIEMVAEKSVTVSKFTLKGNNKMASSLLSAQGDKVEIIDSHIENLELNPKEGLDVLDSRCAKACKSSSILLADTIIKNVKDTGQDGTKQGEFVT